jgi:AraC family transcriptional regulator, regulatory protein of adaptative response / methylated-DNA-[protein]-cysteine methyltransferase
MNSLPSVREMEQAVQGSDASYDGLFVVAVRTTGIFCRPSCPARKPLPRNCEYYATPREALFAGYRPCKRCRPMDANGQPPDWVTGLLAAVEQDPAARWRDADLRGLGVEPARARRYFNAHYGMTFQAYCRGRRMGQALQQIKRGTGLDDVILGNGYESHSGFREAFGRTFGRSPGRSRDADCVTLDWAESPVGPLLVGATSAGVCILEFTDRRGLEGQFAALRKRFRCAVVPGRHEHLDRLKAQLAEYFAGKRTTFDVPLVYPGTPFQEAVWRQLLTIPYGRTCSYEDVARAVGVPKGVRAVGLANGKNRVAIVIPCHRVVNKGGRLGGYGGGLWRKQFLLDLERGVAGVR